MKYQKITTDSLGLDRSWEKALGVLPLGEYEAGPWLCGGAVRDWIMGKTRPVDYDLFVKNQDQFEETRKYLSERFQIQCETNNAITFRVSELEATVQLIKLHMANSIEEVLDKFDYTICQFGYTIDPDLGPIIVANPMAFVHLSKNKLVINKCKCNYGVVRGLVKYSNKGFVPDYDLLKQTVEEACKDPEFSKWAEGDCY